MGHPKRQEDLYRAWEAVIHQRDCLRMLAYRQIHMCLANKVTYHKLVLNNPTLEAHVTALLFLQLYLIVSKDARC